MAKVSGPFMSLDASGTLAGTLTASKWKGRNYIRQRVTPANPNTADQQAVRSIFGTIAKAAHAVLTSAFDPEFVGSVFFQAARDGAPSGQSWISWLQKVMYPLFVARAAAYAALSGTIKGYYNTTALTLGLGDYVDKAGDTHTAGEQLYMLAYFGVNYLGLTIAGGVAAPTDQAAVTAFGVLVHDSTA